MVVKQIITVMNILKYFFSIIVIGLLFFIVMLALMPPNTSHCGGQKKLFSPSNSECPEYSV